MKEWISSPIVKIVILLNILLCDDFKYYKFKLFLFYMIFINIIQFNNKINKMIKSL